MKVSRFKKAFVLLGFSLCLFVSFSIEAIYAAEKEFPTRGVSILVGFQAGGGRDIIARGLSKTMSKYLGVPVVVLNEPGAGGARALIHAYNAAPDGYTIIVGACSEILEQILEKQDYDVKKFAFIGRAQTMANVLFVRSDSPLKSVKDFKTYGKPIRHAAFSLTAPHGVAAMVMADRDKWPLVLIGGYQGVPGTIMGVIRGEAEFYGSQLSSSMSYVRAGQVRPIGILAKQRVPEFPDIPTIGEMGYKDLEVLSLDYWLMAPPQTPKARVQILEDALMKTLKDPEFLAWAKGASVEPGPMSSEETTQMVLGLFKLFEPYKGVMEKYIKK
jgi:tripartite-type tricarboxylate transporter receptor subunit TctC